MAISPLAKEKYPAHASNYTKGRSTKINKITVHHMAAVLTAKQCGGIFQRAGRNGSSHYGIGNGGEIANYVDEANTAWTDSNWSSNCRSVTIETSNSSTGGKWPVSDKALNSLIKLVADIAKRNGLGTLVKGQNLTWHSMYAATACPGDYLRSKMQYIADKANEINKAKPTPAPKPKPAPSPSTGLKVGDKVVPKSYVDYYGTRLAKTRNFYFISSISGDRAVLNADSVKGPIYCAMKTSNLTKSGSAPAPKPAPKPTPKPAPKPAAGIKVGDKVTLTNWVSYTGARLMKTRNFYFVYQIIGDRVVLTADRVNGPIYSAVKKSNLKKV